MAKWVSTEKMRAELKVTQAVVSMWRAHADFPTRAVRKSKDDPRRHEWDVARLKSWLKKWPAPKRGRRPYWFEIVGHKSA